MTLARLTDSAAVRAAIAEFDELGREAFLERYGFGAAVDYLVIDPASGRAYDSKAIAGVAFGKQYPEEGPLAAASFRGGAATVAPALEALGFPVVAPRSDWTDAEVAATVGAYFSMLTEEAAGAKVDKRAYRDRLRPLLLGRSDSAIERKHSNISAVLDEAGYAWVSGFKPLHNYQQLLRSVALERADAEGELFARIMAKREGVAAAPADEPNLDAVFVAPPPRQQVDREPPRRRAPRKYDHAARDAAARALGRKGEEWVLALERRRLAAAGRSDLSERVRWVSEDDGDGAGYDIASFDADGAEMFIEVKTTNGPAETAFLISPSEVRASKELGPAFRLYRVFSFSADARVFVLVGDVEANCALAPDAYRANPTHC